MYVGEDPLTQASKFKLKSGGPEVVYGGLLYLISPKGGLKRYSPDDAARLYLLSPRHRLIRRYQNLRPIVLL